MGHGSALILISHSSLKTPVVSPKGEVTGARYQEEGRRVTLYSVLTLGCLELTLYHLYILTINLAEHLESHRMTYQVIVFHLCCDLFVS